MLTAVKILMFALGLCAFAPDAHAAAEETAERLRGHALANTGGAGRLFALAAGVAEEIAASLEMTGGIVAGRAQLTHKSGPKSYPGAMADEQADRQALGRKLARLLFKIQGLGVHLFSDGQIVPPPETDRPKGSPLERLAERVKSIGDDLDMHKHNAGENNARIYEALDLQEVDNNPDRLFSGVIATVSAKVEDMNRAIGDIKAAIEIETPDGDGDDELVRSHRLERIEEQVSGIKAKSADAKTVNG